jgi:hypothetical protein
MIGKQNHLVYLVTILAIFILQRGTKAQMRTIAFQKVMFEKICWQTVYYSREHVMKHFDKTKTRSACGVACVSTENCTFFAYFDEKSRCRLYSKTFTNISEACYKKQWDYGYFTVWVLNTISKPFTGCECV